MCAFIVRHKTPGLNGGSIRHRPPDPIGDEFVATHR